MKQKIYIASVLSAAMFLAACEGDDGINGTDGANGTDGFNSLIATFPRATLPASVAAWRQTAVSILTAMTFWMQAK